jgi:cytochrome c-type biogenesis protein CcmH
MTMALRALAFAFMLLASLPALAVQPDEILPDPALEARARGLSRELRCMVCQNQSIDDSDAPLARDLRLLVRDRLKAGDSDRQVIDFLTARYGDFVLLNPRFTWRTALLWTLPVVVLLAGGVGLIALFRRRRREIDEEIAGAAGHGLSADEQARIAVLMKKLPE